MAHSTTSVRFASALSTLSLVACIGVSQTPYTGDAASTAATSGKLTHCSGKPVAAIDGLIDDFEDGNNQVMTMGERDGYWWVAHDTLGSTVTEPAEGFQPVEGGADGTAMAAHVKGHI